MRSTRWVVLMMVTVAALGCSQTNGREDVDAAVDTREAPRDAAMQVTLCVGLDLASQACALEVVARIDRHVCEDLLACHPGAYDPRYCDVYPGGGIVSQTRNQAVRVRLGTLRVDLDAAVCVLRQSSCGPVSTPCEPLFVPTRPMSRCMVNEECGRDGYCVGAESSACEAHDCASRLAPGAACAPTEPPCAWGESCIEGQCRRLGQIRIAEAGESCLQSPSGDTFDAWRCAEGSACLATGSGPMVQATCIPVGSLGEPCSVACAPGLRCLDRTCTSIPVPNVGDACSGDFCAGGGWGMPCVDGVCALSAARLGEACHHAFRRCNEGYCDNLESGSVPTCIEGRRAIGESCFDQDECENGLCCNAVCVPVPE